MEITVGNLRANFGFPLTYIYDDISIDSEVVIPYGVVQTNFDDRYVRRYDTCNGCLRIIYATEY